MKLDQLKNENCPECGSKTKLMEKSNQHCNGEWNERRIYQCGHTLHYSPNFRNTVITKPCSKNPEFMEQRKKRVQASAKLTLYIKKLNVDCDFKERILRAIDYILEK